MNGKTWALLIVGLGLVSLVLLMRHCLRRFVVPWFERRQAAKLQRLIQAGELRLSRDRDTIVWDAAGFRVRDAATGTAQPLFPWADVVEATVFKRDNWSSDRICLFLARQDGNGVEIHEDMEGWSGFIEALPACLIGCRPRGEWLHDVTFPPFKANPAVIFSRADPSAQNGGAS